MPEQDKPGPVPTAPKDDSSTTTSAPQDTTPTPESPTDAAPASEDVHEYREVAPGVEARVATDEEKLERKNRSDAEISRSN